MSEPNKTTEVLLAALTQDVAHILTMLAELKTNMVKADATHNEHLDRLKTDLVRADDATRSDLAKADESLRNDMRSAIKDLKDVQTKLESKLQATDEKATQARDSANRMVWVTVGVLSVLIAFCSAILIAKLTK